MFLKTVQEATPKAGALGRTKEDKFQTLIKCRKPDGPQMCTLINQGEAKQQRKEALGLEMRKK